jgi:hypothetical protein
VVLGVSALSHRGAGLVARVKRGDHGKGALACELCRRRLAVAAGCVALRGAC